MSMQPVGNAKNGKSVNRAWIKRKRWISDHRADKQPCDYRFRPEYVAMVARMSEVTAEFKKKNKSVSKKKKSRNLIQVTLIG